MTDTQMDIVHAALRKCSKETDVAVITAETHLVDDGYLDSLDAMVFIFELEKLAGKKFAGFGEEFDDFEVSNILAAMTE